MTDVQGEDKTMAFLNESIPIFFQYALNGGDENHLSMLVRFTIMKNPYFLNNPTLSLFSPVLIFSPTLFQIPYELHFSKRLIHRAGFPSTLLLSI